ncbi:hypothetical protein DVR12_11275 [Chitinophaga silvatica]|uniref:NlpE-like protein n=1 Tax=Chitinophaga silvatica TaxID=2282649 RepID=A0A3E1Y9Q2_9BACT|nr:copper resistance protein NlpE N-terminal domain-containing protein [Chitinophaga silvatica]RFS22387.1 hypothetical protein DVR12_11275 [Chitinophaga silvatica]
MQKSLLLAIGLFALACNNKRAGSNSDSTNNTTGTHQMTKLTGTFQGTIPCADCPGINYQITLFDDHTFSELTSYQAKGMNVEGIPMNVANVENGTWKQLSDSTIMIQRKADNASFLAEDGHLLLLDPKGRRIEGVLAGNYVLNPVEGGDRRTLFAQKRQQGINFTANGNEPGWALDIDHKQIYFHTINGDSIKTALPSPQPNSDSLKVYTTKNITVSIRNTLCTDDMSGLMRPNTVQITYKGKTYRGCGEYLQVK